MKKRNWIISSILVGSVLTMSAAQACGGSGGYGNDHRDSFQGGHKMHMMGGMDMSKEQRQAIREIRNAQRDQMDSIQDEMIDIRKALREQAQSESYDADKVQALANEKAKLVADMTVQRIETMSRIRKQLTPEQLTEMDSFKDRKSGRRGAKGCRR